MSRRRVGAASTRAGRPGASRARRPRGPARRCPVSTPARSWMSWSSARLRRWHGRCDVAGPLEGYRVVEIAEGVAGPYCAMELGDAGADVIKVEPLGGDRARGWGPPVQGDDSAV